MIDEQITLTAKRLDKKVQAKKNDKLVDICLGLPTKKYNKGQGMDFLLNLIEEKMEEQ